MNGLIRTGYKQPLVEDDLFDLNPGLKTTSIFEKWNGNWRKQAEKKSNSENPRLSILPTMVHTFGGRYFKATILLIVTIVLEQV